MYDLMQGVRVIEVAEHTFAPSAAVVLADWGAEVIKVERNVGGGDPARSMRILQRSGQPLPSPAEVGQDVQVLENGIVTAVTDHDGGTYYAAATPGQFDERPIGDMRAQSLLF